MNVKKRNSRRGNGGMGKGGQNAHQRNSTTELKAVLRDILTGALPLCELPGYLTWVFGGMKWTAN